jgi:hypothetical protein
MHFGDIHTEATVGSQGFSRKFEQDSFVHSCKVSHIWVGFPFRGPDVLGYSQPSLAGLVWQVTSSEMGSTEMKRPG